MKKAVIVSTKRSPVGKVCKSLASVEPHKLGAAVLRALIDETHIDTASIDEVILGNLVNYNYANIARVTALEAGLPVSVPAITIDRQCSSALNAIAYAGMMINTGNADIVVAGGIDCFSQQPLMLEKAASPYQRQMRFVGMRDSVESVGMPSMIQVAENIAEKYSITREECDEFADRSHKLAAAAWENGYFDKEIVPISILQRKGDPIVVDKDECVRFDSSVETLAKLKPIIGGGVVTAGNSSPVNDGAAMVLMMSEETAEKLGYEALAVVEGYACAALDPNYMGLGPIEATRKLLNKFNLTMDDIDLFELNEAFASQSIACVKDLEIPYEILNVNGGAIAIGHPNGASGAILTGRLVHEMVRRNSHYGIVSFCVGGGQGFSVLFSR